MKFRLTGSATALGLMALVCLMAVVWAGSAAAQSQAAQAQATAQAKAATAKGQTAGEFFKNVTTSTLKGLSPSDFLGAMGVMTAAVGYDCSNCHPGAGTDTFDWVTDRIPQKKTARKMVEMVAAINRQNFGGAQMVTCWTCHHGLDLPTTSIALDKLYGEPNEEKRDIVVPGEGMPPATQVLDQYIQAMGGAQKLAGVKSFIATGHSEGYAGLGGNGAFQIFAQAPDHRGMWINFPDHPDRGTSAWTYDGNTGWISSPRGYLNQYELTGNDLAGAKLDSVLAFPGEIKTAFPNWRIGVEDTLDGRDIYVVQGSGTGGMLGTFYFDKQTHLLTRFVRRTPSPVGRITIQQDFADYRDVNGVKFPFKYSFLWLDGRFTAIISDVKVNVPIDAAKFAKP
ncbi:MAG TPA: photosynthetic reaction center cytochrome c subunit family protein [Bryobacteraceae bacterium]|nr:photosynthetic reaction center cytochrome c subunit family protein [Bryobacteraceae bacterium]